MEELSCEKPWKVMVTCGGWMGQNEVGGTWLEMVAVVEGQAGPLLFVILNDSHSQGLVSICVQ